MMILGDCLQEMAKMEEGSVDLVVTSPPYNLRNSSGGFWNGKDGGKRWRNSKLQNESGYAETEDNMKHEDYVAWQKECLTAMMRLLPETGAIFYVHKWRTQNGLLQDRSDIVDSFPVRQIIIWQRSGGVNFNETFFLPTYEVIYLIAKPKFRLAHQKNKYKDIWTIPQARNNPHPAPFPAELARRCIDSTDAKTVLDPFLGSGTTAVAAIALGRNWIGIEQSAEYVKMAEERIRKEEARWW